MNRKKVIFSLVVSIPFFALFLSSCSSPAPSDKKQLDEEEISRKVVAETEKVLQEKAKDIYGFLEKLSEVEKKNSELKEKIAELNNLISSLQSRISTQADEWDHKYFQQQMVLIIFQIYNYVQQEGELPPDLSTFILDKDKWSYEKISDTNFSIRCKIYPEIRYSGSISVVERIIRPPSEWKYIGKVSFETEMAAMILNEVTGDTRFVRKGDWVGRFQIQKVTDEGIYLTSPRGKSVIPYTGGG